MKLWRFGSVAEVADAAAAVDAFRRSAGALQGAVAPWNAPVGSDLDVPLADTRHGWLVSEEAECRWRVEGGRAVVTIISEAPVPGLACVETDVEQRRMEAPLSWSRDAYGTARGRPRQVVYLAADGEVAATRVTVEDQP